MPNFQAISYATHGQKRWLRATSFSFALRDGILPLGIAEVAKAALSLPLAFIQRETTGFVPVAVMSLQPGHNHFVTPDGRWPHGYIPAASRAYPFRLFGTGEDQHILAIDEDAGLICEGADGEAFFDAIDKPSAAIREVMRFLEAHEIGLRAARGATACLNEFQLLKPWEISVKNEHGVQKLGGLFQVDQEALNQLPGEALKALLNAGGLLLAYSQLLSMQHLPFLGELASAHAEAAKRVADADRSLSANGELDLEFLKRSETLSFGGFR